MLESEPISGEKRSVFTEIVYELRRRALDGVGLLDLIAYTARGLGGANPDLESVVKIGPDGTSAVLRLALPRAALAAPPRRTLYRRSAMAAGDARLTPQRRRALDAMADLPALPVKEAARIAGVGEGAIKGLAKLGLAETIAGRPPVTARMLKSLLRQSLSSGLFDFLDNCAALQAICHTTDDHLEAVTAMLEKRLDIT